MTMTRRASSASTSTRFEAEDSTAETVATAATTSEGGSHHRSRHVHVNSIFPPPDDLPEAEDPNEDSEELAERRERLADVARCASLADVHVDVAIAHTRHRLRARFFVELARSQPRRAVWGVGTSLSELRGALKRMKRAVRGRQRSGAGCETRGEPCAMCKTLRSELRKWPRISRLSVLTGPHGIADKATRVERFFGDAFKLLAAHAQWAYQCVALREVLLIVEGLARVRYPGDRDSLAAIATFRPLSTCSPLAAECMICLEPLEAKAVDSCRVERHTKRKSSLAMAAVEQSRSGVRLPCGHEYHDTCVSRWLGARRDCPMCRTPIVKAESVVDVSALVDDTSELSCSI